MVLMAFFSLNWASSLTCLDLEGFNVDISFSVGDKGEEEKEEEDEEGEDVEERQTEGKTLLQICCGRI